MGPDGRLPASYANFYFANAAVLVPVFGVAADREAIAILEKAIPDRPIVPIPGQNLVLGSGGGPLPDAAGAGAAALSERAPRNPPGFPGSLRARPILAAKWILRSSFHRIRTSVKPPWHSERIGGPGRPSVRG